MAKSMKGKGLDHRSLEDKILKQNLLTMKESDEEGDLVDTDDESEPEPDPFAEEMAKGASGAAGFGRGGDGLAPSTSFAGASGKQGPKGVLADYRLAQADLKRRREREALRRTDFVRGLGGATTQKASIAFSSEGGQLAQRLSALGLHEKPRAVEDKEDREADKSDLDDSDLSDDFGDADFMKKFRERRLAELKTLAAQPKFGEVKEISKFELVTETDEERKNVWVVVHLYESFNPGCRAINDALPAVARDHPTIKFLRLVASEASDSLDHVALPVLVIYRGGKTAHAMVRACDHLGPEPTAADIEWFLALVKVIEAPASSDGAATGAGGAGAGSATVYSDDEDEDEDDTGEEFLNDTPDVD